MFVVHSRYLLRNCGYINMPFNSGNCEPANFISCVARLGGVMYVRWLLLKDASDSQKRVELMLIIIHR